MLIYGIKILQCAYYTVSFFFVEVGFVMKTNNCEVKSFNIYTGNCYPSVELSGYNFRRMACSGEIFLKPINWHPFLEICEIHSNTMLSQIKGGVYTNEYDDEKRA